MPTKTKKQPATMTADDAAPMAHDLAARLAAIEAENARLKAEAEAAKAEAEKAKAEAAKAIETPKPTGFQIVPRDRLRSQWEAFHGSQIITGGRRVDLRLNPKGFYSFNVDERLIVTRDGKRMMTRGLEGRPEQFVELVAFILENPDDARTWCDSLTAAAVELAAK